MNEAQFIDVVRQYASAARRKHMSFAGAVHSWTQQRADTIKQEFTDPKERAQALSNMQAFLKREYAPDDPTFSTVSYD